MKKLLFLSMIVCGFSASAQESWNLGKCIKYAIENNLDMRSAAIDAQVARENLTASKYGALPNVNASATHAYQFGEFVNPFIIQTSSNVVRSNQFNLSSSVTLFNGLNQYNQIKSDELEVAASDKSIEQVKNDLALSVAQFYFNAVTAQEIAEAADLQISITRENLARTDKLVKAETLPAGELLLIEAQLANDLADKIDAENNYTMAMIGLKNIMQYQGQNFVPEQVEVTEVSFDSAAYSPDGIKQAAYTNLPQMQTTELQMRSAEYQLKAAKGLKSPSLTLSASAGTGYSGIRTEVTSETLGAPQQIGTTTSGEAVFVPTFDRETGVIPFSTQLNDNLSEVVTFRLNIPIFNGFSAKTSVNRARLNVEQVKNNKARAEQQINQDVEQAYADAKANMKRYEAAKKRELALQMAFDYNKKRFEAGAINALDYTQSKTDLDQARITVVQAKYGVIFSQKVLDFYNGQPIIE